MKISFTNKFIEKYHLLPKKIQQKVNKQINSLLQNFRHPSLRAKKYDKKRDIWQARVNRGYRFYFLIRGDTYILLEIKPHPK